MDKIQTIVRMNEAPARPLHLHRIVRPVLNEDGELDFVGVDEHAEQLEAIANELTQAEKKMLAEYQPSPLPVVQVKSVVSRKEIRGTPAHLIRRSVLPQLFRDQIELSLTRMITEYRTLWWRDEDRKDAERLIKAHREQALAETQSRQQEKEDQSNWDFLYSNEEDFEI